MDTANSRKLKELFRTNPDTRSIIDVLKTYQRNRNSITVAILSKHTGLPDPRVKDALHEFEAVGVGRYVPGRWHNSNRFEFSRKLNEIAAVATGERGDFADDVDDDIDVANSSGPPMVEQLLSNAEANGAGRNGAVTLSFQIAGGLEPSIRVPTKLTRKDAESLVAFVKSLPFDASA